MIDRINHIIHSKGLNLSKFAEEIGVQRSNISHILSGRNKPSLDFVMKILERYPEVSTDWLINGKGSFNIDIDLFEQPKISYTSNEKIDQNTSIDEIDEKTTEKIVTSVKKSLTDNKASVAKYNRNIKRIILLYDDNSFEELTP